jgi:hypothetical protein
MSDRTEEKGFGDMASRNSVTSSDNERNAVIPNASEDGRAGDTQQSSDMVEPVARAIAASFELGSPGIAASLRMDWQTWAPEAKAALEASYHAELVEMLTEARNRLAMVGEQHRLIGRIDALLAKLNGAS